MNVDIQRRVRVADIEHKIRENQLRWFGHVRHCPEDALVRKVEGWNTWIEGVKNDIKKLCSRIGEEYLCGWPLGFKKPAYLGSRSRSWGLAMTSSGTLQNVCALCTFSQATEQCPMV